jgi:hypothetical protein
MPEITARQRRGIEYRRQVRESEREWSFASTALGLNDPQRVHEWSAALISARMTHQGKVFAKQCLRGHDRETAFAYDTEPETVCAGCGKAIGDHEVTR